MYSRSFGICVFLLSFTLVLVFSGCDSEEDMDEAFGEGISLVSRRIFTAPVVDGQMDTVWNDSEEVAISTASGANTGFHTVYIRSVHTEDDIYFLIRWDDHTESLERFPWEKQIDGSWKKLETPDAEHDENVWYEDKLAFIWDINGSMHGFENVGCAATCHVAVPGKAFGYKKAPEGGMGDIWHWKSVRSNPVKQIDDQYLDDTEFAPDVNNGNAGRRSDPSEGGGYSNNQDEGAKKPAFTSPTQPAPPYWILDVEKQPFVDNYVPGDKIAGIVTARRLGDRGHITAKGVYGDEQWILEIGRRRNTGSGFDVQFTDPLTEYPFGVAIFDNAQVRHSWGTDVLKLRLEQ